MSDLILVVNAGSSSLKFHMYAVDQNEQLVFDYGGQVSGIGGDAPAFKVADAQGQLLERRTLVAAQAPDLHGAQALVTDWLLERLDREPIAVGHRIVHGGPRYDRSLPLTPQVLEYLDSLSPLAPLHQQNNLAPVRVIFERWPEIFQVACLDTAFHQGHAPYVQRFALPEHLYGQGVRRYGFHGLSYHYIAQHLQQHWPQQAQGRVLVAHLGSGASACALHQGRSVETTMGFTALDGVPMGTRPGRLDAGVVLWMMEQGMDHDAIQSLLYTESGLKGLSGISADMRVLEQSDDPRATLAIDYFCYRAAECLAGLCVSLQGLDTLVFTAGIGEHSPAARAGIARHLAWLGVEIDPARNQAGQTVISTDASAVKVLVIPTNEERVIAEQSLALVRSVPVQ
ncbi:MAG TPA: acetate/propionate family kinase [Alcaligenes sp.]|nr:acetate/propionate family kinase [Alcaligenes sp.]HRL26866.1 acetate/propionate family kinase [Alcaligenes sp.]